MKILFYIGHPAQYLFLKNSIKILQLQQVEFKILIKTKDVLETLLLRDKVEFENILQEQRGSSTFSIFISLIRRIIKLYLQTIKFKPQLMIGTDSSVAIVGKILNIPRISITEDDYEVIKILGDLTYPFTNTILCPKVCKVGKWNSKKYGYNGYMKLAYLHPNVFKLNKLILEKYNFPKNYSIIRLSQLAAYHDKGIDGISQILLDQIIQKLEYYSIRVFISSETNIDSKYSKYLLTIKPEDIHQILAHSTILVSDSQSMSVEAALLGVPSIRISSFVGKISVLEELEHKYKLTFGIDPNSSKIILTVLIQILEMKNLKNDFQKRRSKMLKEKIDVTNFLVSFLYNYPKSLNIEQANNNILTH